MAGPYIQIEDFFDQKYRNGGGQYQILGAFSGVGAYDAQTGFGAKGDGVTDDTQALSTWVNAMNAATPGGALGVLPAGNYLTSAALPALTAAGTKIIGAGWAQTAFTKGSSISAKSGYSGTAMVTLSGEGCELCGVMVDGQGNASPDLIRVTAPNCRLVDFGTHGVAGGSQSVCVNIVSGAVSCWVVGASRVNGINFPNTGIQVADTDCIIANVKPTNNTTNIMLLSGSDGAQIQDCHMTPGSSGANCIWVNGNPSHVQIDGNRFDNYVRSAIQITPPSSTPNSIHITHNHFHSNVQTDNTYPLIGLDTTASGVRGLHIVGNSGYGSSTHRPKYFVSAIVQDGTAPTNTGRLTSLGTLCNSNTAWCNTSFFAADAPSVARGNMTATDGQTYTAVVDI